jgi:class 3 adenylate cyclase
MDITQNEPDDRSVHSDIALVPLVVPKTVQKKRLVFEGEELEPPLDASQKLMTFNDSFNPFQTGPLDDNHSQPEDEFEREEKPDTLRSAKKTGACPALTLRIKDVLNSIYYTILINAVTLYVLFADYFRIIFFSNDADAYFDVFTIICFSLLVLDFVMVWATHKNYFLSFFFFLDFVMTFTIVFDVTTVAREVFSSNNDNLKMITSNILRIIRIIRLIRIMKLFRTKNKRPETKETESAARKSEFFPSKTENSFKKIFTPKESKVTTQLKETNVQRIILIVLLILIFVPLFDNSLYYQDRSSTTFDKALFGGCNIINTTDATKEALTNNIINSLADSRLVLAQYIIWGHYNYTDPSYPGLRDDEIDEYTGTIAYQGIPYAVSISISHRPGNVLKALMSLLNTIFVGFIMIFSILSLNNDMSTLVLTPLERMVGKIRLIGINPLLALRSTTQKGDEDAETNETHIIEAAINKITSLLMLGFGQAGCKIVSGFILNPNRDIDQLIPGEKTFAIFGFCDIKGFSDVTELLVEDIMLFVNTIAEIVHQGVDEFAGATNKNIGEAFLMVWKLMDDGYRYLIDEDFRADIHSLPAEAQNPRLQTIFMEDRFNKQLAEFALLGFTKVLMEVHTNPDILKFSEHPILCARLPGFKIQMSFGLHIGWAIEGAIGSSFKIDASYLSPNVNLASRVQYACKQFGVSLLFSGNLFELFTNGRLLEHARHIDTVNLKGSKLPIKLYTYDYNVERLKVWKREQTPTAALKTVKVDLKGDLQQQFMDLLRKNASVADLGATAGKSRLVKFSSLAEESLAEKKLSEPDFARFFDFDNQERADFRSICRFAVSTYLAGDWKTGRLLFDRCLKIKPTDGPSQTIFNYMANRNFEVPANWKNCREMTEK